VILYSSEFLAILKSVIAFHEKIGFLKLAAEEAAFT
jgi:hypothetical protein